MPDLTVEANSDSLVEYDVVNHMKDDDLFDTSNDDDELERTRPNKKSRL
jgi:hypothetical protein